MKTPVASYRYPVVDVFTETPLEGNPLAVFPEAAGLSTAMMQRIAREFNLSETAFLLPPSRADCVAQIRMFLEQRACLRLIAESTRRNKTVDPREFVFRAMSQQPGRHLVIPVQRGERMHRASIGPALIYIRSVGDQQLHRLNVHSLCRNVERRLARLRPCQVRIGSVLQ